MKKNIFIPISALIIFVAFKIFVRQELNVLPSADDFHSTTQRPLALSKSDLPAVGISTEKHHEKQKHQNTEKPSTPKSLPPLPFQAKNSFEKSALKIGSLLGSTLAKPHKTRAQVMRDFRALGLEPLATREKSDTGSAPTMIRSSNNLPGTRYLHAQVFQTETGEEIVQYLAFEFAPGKESFARMKDLARSQIQGTVLSEISDEHMHIWKLSSGYNIWVKSLQKEDMENDPFNAYSPQDLGSVRVVIEQEVHSDEHESGHL